MRTRSFFYNSWLNCYQGQITPQDFSSKLNNTRTQPKIIKPLHKDASLHCMDNAAEAWLVFVSAKFQAPLPGKCGSQPVPDLWWHWVWLDVTQLILCIHQPPAVKVTFTKKTKTHTVYNFCRLLYVWPHSIIRLTAYLPLITIKLSFKFLWVNHKQSL